MIGVSTVSGPRTRDQRVFDIMLCISVPAVFETWIKHLKWYNLGERLGMGIESVHL